MINLRQIAQALDHEFLDLADVTSIRLLGSGFGSIAVEVADSIVFRVARTPDSGQNYAKEAEVLPLLKSHLPIDIPEPKWYVPHSKDFPFGVIGYHKLVGHPLKPEDIKPPDQQQKIAGQIARFILALQHIPPESVHLRIDNDKRFAQWTKQRDIVLPVLQTTLQSNEYQLVKDWWDTFLADRTIFQYHPVIQHGDLWYGNLLFDGTALVGVIDFEQLEVGDPASDFATQLHLGEHFLNSVIDAFCNIGGNLDENFHHRLYSLWALREFSGLEYSIRYDDQDEFQDSLLKLRKGPILNAGGSGTLEPPALIL
jgi:aminoglycoside phosphotransferase (APT) family kinase protein